MGHWIFFTTGFEYKLVSGLQNIEELGGECYYSFIDDIWIDYLYRYSSLIDTYANKYNVKECVCCLEELEKEIVLPCAHVLCNRCLYKITQKSFNEKRKSSCPICRCDFVKESIKDEIKKIFNDKDIGEEMIYYEEDYQKIIQQDSKLKVYVDHCVKWNRSNLCELEKIINNEQTLKRINEYEKNIEGTNLLRRDIHKNELTEKVKLASVIYHQLLYSDELRVNYSV